MSRRKIFHRDAIRILDISRNRRISRAWRGSRRDVSPFRSPLHYIPPNEEVLSGSFSTHEYHIHCNGLCTLQATSTPFPKLNYLSPVRFSLHFVFVPLQLLRLFCIISDLYAAALRTFANFSDTIFQRGYIIKLGGKSRALLYAARYARYPIYTTKNFSEASKISCDA